MHCWNVVKVDGIWQNIDFTHNLNFSHKELRRYDSFCVSNDALFTSHHLDPTTPKYVCEEHHLNYYWQMPLHLMRHSDIPILAKVLDENKAVAFLVKKEMSLDVAARKVVDACTLSDYHFSLSVNEDRHVIGIIAHK